MVLVRLAPLLGLLALAAGSCNPAKARRYGNCSFSYQCDVDINAQLPQQCQEATNEPVLVDLHLTNPAEQIGDQDFLSYVTTLKISTTEKLTKLPYLKYTTRLVNLILCGNWIDKLLDNPFFTLATLENLDLSHNKISEIDPTLFIFEFQPSRLQKLSLANNRLEEVPSDAFEELTFLTELDLSNNFITTLSSEPFSNLTNLEKLRLENNRIQNLNGAVNNLQNLKHLYLRGNQIENIDEASLKIIIHLETFDVSWNQLAEVKPIMLSRHWQHFGGHSVCKIILSDNRIKSVPNATFPEISTRYARHLPRIRPVDVLTELDLSRNDICNIEYNAFQSVIKLDSLDLSANRIEYFYVNGEDIASVRFLNLSNNMISQIYYESFFRMKNLQNLDMSHNRFDVIPEKTFNNNHYLKHVNMTYNALEKLDDLYIDMFHPDGGILDLSNNNLTRLRISSGKGRRLSVLILHSNNIMDPSLIDLRHQSDLKNLDLSRNKISKLETDSFLLPGGLNYLDLSFNLITYIAPSAFRRNGNLKTLRLPHNYLTNIEYGAFSGLRSLLNLDLSFNMLLRVDATSMMELKSLAVLSLRHNGLHVLNDEAWFGHKVNLKVYLEGNNITCKWLSKALQNFYNGHTKMRPTVLEDTLVGNSIDGIPCVQDQAKSEKLQAACNSCGLTDERLLITNQKILEAVKEQTYYLKKYVWRSLQDDEDRARSFS